MRVLEAIPGLVRLRAYDRAWLRPDFLAGLTVWALLVPQALAYAQLAGLDPVVGLYASIGAIVGYALFGGAREMSVGPEATIGLLTASVIAPLAVGDPGRYLALAATLALLTGVLLALAGLARLGFISRYLSRPLLVGYVAGSAVVMIVSQLDSLLGVTIAAQDDTVLEFTQTVAQVPATHGPTLAVGLLTIAVAAGIRRLDRRLPAFLIAVGVALAVSIALGLEDQGVKVVGEIAAGLPPIGLPSLAPSDLGVLLGPAIAVAVLVYADSGVTGQVLSRRGGYRLDPDGEFFGLGAANIGASLTAGFPVNGSQSRSFTAADVGARSPVAGLVVLGLVVATLLVLTPLFAQLPKAALGGIIVVVAIGLIDPPQFRDLWRFARREAALAIAAMAIVIVVGMLAGVLAIVVLSLLLVAQRAALPNTTTLFRVVGTDTFRGPDTAVGGSAIPGIVIYRFDAPLFFANASILSDEIVALVADGAGSIRAVVLDAEGITDIDSTGAEMLVQLAGDLAAQDVTFCLARTRIAILAAMERGGLLAIVGRDRVFLEVSDAVDALGG